MVSCCCDQVPNGIYLQRKAYLNSLLQRIPSVISQKAMQDSSACGCWSGRWWFVHILAGPGVEITFQDPPLVTDFYQLTPPPKAFKILLQARSQVPKT